MTRERWIIGGIGAFVGILIATGAVLALGGDDGGSDVAIMAAVVVGILVATNLGFAWLASRARSLIKSRRAVKTINRTSGTLMIGAGAWVATR